MDFTVYYLCPINLIPRNNLVHFFYQQMSNQQYYQSGEKQTYQAPSAPPPGFQQSDRGVQDYNRPPQQAYGQQPQQGYYQQGPPQQGYYQQGPPQQGYYQQQQPVYVQQQQPQRDNSNDCCMAYLAALCICCTLDALF